MNSLGLVGLRGRIGAVGGILSARVREGIRARAHSIAPTRPHL